MPVLGVYLHVTETWFAKLMLLSSQYTATEPALQQLANSVALSTQPLTQSHRLAIAAAVTNYSIAYLVPHRTDPLRPMMEPLPEQHSPISAYISPKHTPPLWTEVDLWRLSCFCLHDCSCLACNRECIYCSLSCTLSLFQKEIGQPKILCLT